MIHSESPWAFRRYQLPAKRSEFPSLLNSGRLSVRNGVNIAQYRPSLAGIHKRRAAGGKGVAQLLEQGRSGSALSR